MPRCGCARLSVIVIEVALIAAVTLGAQAAPTLGRDTMFALLSLVSP